jgi:hypothetical protein
MRHGMQWKGQLAGMQTAVELATAFTEEQRHDEALADSSSAPELGSPLPQLSDDQPPEQTAQTVSELSRIAPIWPRKVHLAAAATAPPRPAPPRPAPPRPVLPCLALPCNVRAHTHAYTHVLACTPARFVSLRQREGIACGADQRARPSQVVGPSGDRGSRCDRRGTERHQHVPSCAGRLRAMPCHSQPAS